MCFFFWYIELQYIIHGMILCFQIDLEDISDPEIFSFYAQPNVNKPCNFPTPKEDTRLASELSVPVKVKKEKV